MLSLLLVGLLAAAHASHEVFMADPIEIPEKKDLYEYWFDVEESMTMVLPAEDATVLLWNKEKGRLEKRDEESCGATHHFQTSELGDGQFINTGDGLHRRIMTINGSMPAQTIVVYQGSKVHVHVRNRLRSRAVMLHFHGMLQTDNFWHDGGGKLSQCPIMPDQVFTYKFVAETPGTYFYHGHFEDRGDGMEGALIVLPKEKPRNFNSKEGSKQVDRQYLGFLQDWYPTSFEDQYTHVKWGTNRYAYGFQNMDKCYAETKTFDGGRVGQLTWHSALVNGRGWNNTDDLLNRPHLLPLETFAIKKGEQIAIRFVNSAVLFPFAVSIDGHNLEVVASDGHDIKPVIVSYLNIFPGERYDVLIKGQSNPSNWKYFIKVQSLESYEDDMSPLNEHHFTLAYLKYEDFVGDYTPEKPAGLKFDSEKRSRVAKRMLNCPFKKFPREYTINCINYDQITGAPQPNNHVTVSSGTTIMGFNLFNDKSINGIRFVYPDIPPLLHGPNQDKLLVESCTKNPSKCNHFKKIPLGNKVKIVLYNKAKKLEDPKALDAFAHPFHIHGHHFKVIDVGYPEYGSDGLITKFNEKVICRDEECNDADVSFASSVEKTGGPAAMKDTVGVPVGGYVIIEFIANNPGWWPAHCHMLPHHMDGMAVALKVGEHADMPAKPEGYPTCSDMQY